MANFALTGVAGYIAPRHLRAIKDSGNTLLAACDPHDSVGVLDSSFPDASFFTEFERFDRHIEKLRRGPSEERVHYVSICTPNHLHDAHIRQALRVGADAICEKPIVLNPWNLDALAELEHEYGQRIWTILQLRVHPSILKLKEKLERQFSDVEQKNDGGRCQVDLTYITTRGLWYDYSWKGQMERSGGIATNIGVHFFDLLLWLFGYVRSSELHISQTRRMSGFLNLRNADVRWYLSLERDDLPDEVVQSKGSTFRSITVDGKELEFTGGFADLHTEVYRTTLEGNGFGLEDAYPSIQLVHNLRHASPMTVPDDDRRHPLVQRRNLA